MTSAGDALANWYNKYRDHYLIYKIAITFSWEITIVHRDSLLERESTRCKDHLQMWLWNLNLIISIFWIRWMIEIVQVIITPIKRIQVNLPRNRDRNSIWRGLLLLVYDLWYWIVLMKAKIYIKMYH